MHRIVAAGYAIALTLVTVMGYIPGLEDANGRLFGVFRLTWYNDTLHLASAAWAAIAALLSPAASLLFLRVFGGLYLLDGLMGLLLGSGYLDLGIIIYGLQSLPLAFRIAANTPHILLGTIALVAGFIQPRPAKPASLPASYDNGKQQV